MEVKPILSRYVRRRPNHARGACLSSIQRLDEEIDMIGVSKIDEAGRLTTVDMLRKLALEERVLDVELMNWLRVCRCQRFGSSLA
jgi:hypothetical protein